MDRQFVYRYVFGYSPEVRVAEQVVDVALDAGALEAAQERSQATIAELRRQLREQQEESAQLGVFVGVLVKMLREQGVLDENTLHQRVDGELAALERAARQAETDAKAAAQARRDALPHVRCIRCERRVLTTATMLTAEGPICDECMSLGT